MKRKETYPRLRSMLNNSMNTDRFFVPDSLFAQSLQVLALSSKET
jgi:hypothetical protein